MIDLNAILENASDDIRELNNNIYIFFEHVVKFVALQDNPSVHWLGSIKNALRNIVQIKNKSKSVYKNYILDFKDIRTKIVKSILKQNPYKNESDFDSSITEVFNTFSSLNLITNNKYLVDYLLKKDVNDQFTNSINALLFIK